MTVTEKYCEMARAQLLRNKKIAECSDRQIRSVEEEENTYDNCFTSQNLHPTDTLIVPIAGLVLGS